ncbi:MAG: HAD hydrolase family protein, partial [Candidatus Krumholzibacteriota bacterium]|nr:HAD hydrolase family protein [Candidatus Krumholzibacteriota bacterium]
ESYLARSGLEGEEIAYIGDEINDLCLIGKVGLFFAVQDANRLVREAADYILPVKGGEGALRVFAETVLSLEGSLRRARDKFQAENEAARKGHGTKGEYISLDD